MERPGRSAAGRAEANGVTFTPAGVRRGARALLPMVMFFIPFGIAFGAAATSKGLSASESLWMSGLVVAGVAQFAALELWTAPLPLASIAAVTLVANLRMAVFSATLARWINPLPLPTRLLCYVGISDVTFVQTHADLSSGGRDLGRLLGGGLVLWLGWMVGTAVGAGASAALGPLDAFGVDIVMPAFFAAVLVGRVRRIAYAAPLAAAAFTAVATAAVLPAGWNIILATAAAGLVEALRRDA